MILGHWSLVIGHWSLVIGHWSLVICHWSLVIVPWSLVPGHLSLVIGPWSLVISPWSLVPGPWSLVIGRWLLVIGQELASFPGAEEGEKVRLVHTAHARNYSKGYMAELRACTNMTSTVHLNSINRHNKISQLFFLGCCKHRCYMFCLVLNVWEAMVGIDLPKWALSSHPLRLGTRLVKNTLFALSPTCA